VFNKKYRIKPSGQIFVLKRETTPEFKKGVFFQECYDGFFRFSGKDIGIYSNSNYSEYLNNHKFHWSVVYNKEWFEEIKPLMVTPQTYEKIQQFLEEENK